MKTIKRTEIYDAPADIVFGYLDNLGVTGMYMTALCAWDTLERIIMLS